MCWASHQKISDLIEPINDLEKNHDKDSVWRTYVNNVLQYDYQKLFSLCSYLIMLKPPSFQSIYEWRHQQEDKICNKSAYKMNKEQVINFVQYFQRLTVWMLDDLPSKSDILIEFDKNHLIKKLVISYEKNFIIFTDLDATLLDENYSWEKAIPALNELNKLKIPLILNSSKTM